MLQESTILGTCQNVPISHANLKVKLPPDMAFKSDKTRCNLTGSAISRERLRVVRVNATVARRRV
eukprot:3414085-Prymnesium_polylepis.1